MPALLKNSSRKHLVRFFHTRYCRQNSVTGNGREWLIVTSNVLVVLNWRHMTVLAGVRMRAVCTAFLSSAVNNHLPCVHVTDSTLTECKPQSVTASTRLQVSTSGSSQAQLSSVQVLGKRFNNVAQL